LNSSCNHNHNHFWMIFYSFGKTWYSPMCTKFQSSSIPEIWMGPPNLKWVTWRYHALSGTVYSLYTGTSYDRPVYQIWNLYVNSLQRYERRRKMQKFGWFGVLRVTQGQQQHTIWYSTYDFLFDFTRNYASILYRFQVIAHFPLKVANFNPPH